MNTNTTTIVPDSQPGFLINDSPTVEESNAALKEYFAGINASRREQRSHAEGAHEALARLVKAMAHRSGQSYKIRDLLYSLWNGRRADLSEVQCLDWSLRRDFATVLLAFGFEGEILSFEDRDVSDAMRVAGLWEFFCEEAA